MLPTPAPSPAIDPCNHPPAIVNKAPLRNYGMFPAVMYPRQGPPVTVSDPLFGQAQPQRLPLTVSLDVLVSTVGSPMQAIVLEPSGDPFFDQAALGVAMHSTYSPGETKCVPQRMHFTLVETLGPAL